ncbi:hypothetical protein E3O55_13025 [Cryobacterium sp. MDB1-18-2]|uniref:hypothetical protein n=1 Tax=unclassified Cryobacterium TaxID=2649013 RepID=UPI0010698211|nr:MULTISPECIES: hypothetical protein [unclassified Cryobacterium]TFC26996.1 hypothetical protein E3O55_13025 [Cryobacterium sp. MDB1-18-2]TFC44188.1 hypothetical protein E3O50_06040 [Cryobacterium sp. MDB1-18-1]
MTKERESRHTVNVAAQDLTLTATTTSLKPGQSNPAKPATLIGATVEKALDATLWRLKSGELGLEDLTPALAAFYTIGHADGMAQMVYRLQQVEADRDRYYQAVFNPRLPIKIGPSYAEREIIRAEIYAGGTR